MEFSSFLCLLKILLIENQDMFITFFFSQNSIPFLGSNHRIGLYRYDGILGLWFEGASIMSSTKNINLKRYDVLQ